MKKLIKKFFALLGFEFSRINRPTDVFGIQKYLTKDFDAKLTIFDIGAYDGRTALKYKNLFPESRIFSFEPFPDSFSKLVKNTSSFDNIIAVNKAIGKEDGYAKFNSNNFAPTNSLLDTHESGSKIWGENLLETNKTIDVELQTIDSFVETHSVKKIDILKIDAQGAEYMVLESAKKSFNRSIVNIIYTEIITLLPTKVN